jgi:hypothetical protein
MSTIPHAWAETSNSFMQTKDSSHHTLMMETVSELSANSHKTDIPI